MCDFAELACAKFNSWYPHQKKLTEELCLNFPAVERQFSVSSMDRERGVFLLISFER